MPSRKGHEILIFLQLFVMIKDNPCRCIWLRFCLYCFTCCLCVNLQAQQAGDSITGKVHAIPEVSVKGRKISSRITSATPTQSFSRKDFEALGLQGIADAVKRFSGVNVKDYGGLGGLKTISIRNLGAAHTAVSYDGIAVSNSQAGQIDIGRFATDNISTLSLSIGQSDNQPVCMLPQGYFILSQNNPNSFQIKNTISTDKLKEVLSVCSIASHVGNNKWELTQPLLLMGISCVQMERILLQ